MSRARFSKHVVGPIDCFLMIVVQQHNPYVPGALKGATWEKVLVAFNELGSESFPEWQPFDRAQTIQDRSAMLMNTFHGLRHAWHRTLKQQSLQLGADMIQNAERSAIKHLELHKPDVDWESLSIKERLAVMLSDSNQIYAVAMLKDLTTQIVAKIEATPPRRAKPQLDDASPGSPEKSDGTPIIKRPRGRPSKRSLSGITNELGTHAELDEMHSLHHDDGGAVVTTTSADGSNAIGVGGGGSGSGGEGDEHDQQQQQQQQHVAGDGSTGEGGTMVVEMSGTATPPPKRRRIAHSLTPSSKLQSSVVEQNTIERLDRWFEQLLQREQHFQEERLKAEERDREERRRAEEREREERQAAIERQTAILTAFLAAVLTPAQKAALAAEINNMPEETAAASPVVTALLSVLTATSATDEQLQQQ